MTHVALSISTALPELFVLIMIGLILVLGLFTQDKSPNYFLAQLTLLGAAALTFLGAPDKARVVFHGMFILDPLAVVLKLFIYLNVFFVFLYSRHYIRARKIASLEYYLLSLFSLLGMMVLVSAHNFITLFYYLKIKFFNS